MIVNPSTSSAPMPGGQRQPVSDIGPSKRPPLEVLPDGYLSPRTRRRRARLAAVAGTVLACALLFGLAGVHVLLTQGAFQLAQYQKESAVEQAKYVRNRENLAQLESPERIAAVAQQKLGMVPSTGPTYLPTPGAGVPGASLVANTPGHRSSSIQEAAPLQDWSLAKPALPNHP
jgi:hypothetical protein